MRYCPDSCSIRSTFPSFGNIYRRIRNTVERHRAHCALDPAAFGARSVADGDAVRLCDIDPSDLVSRGGPLQHRLVCRRPIYSAALTAQTLFVRFQARAAAMTITGKYRLMIFGPKEDRTYLVEFRTAEGNVLAGYRSRHSQVVARPRSGRPNCSPAFII